ncbi:hypothetical protein CR513_05898, partial [Mucuna pruriens]
MVTRRQQPHHIPILPLSEANGAFILDFLFDPVVILDVVFICVVPALRSLMPNKIPQEDAMV